MMMMMTNHFHKLLKADRMIIRILIYRINVSGEFISPSASPLDFGLK